MFSKADKPKSPTRPHSNHSVPSILAPSLKIIGNLITDGEVQIDGIVEGDLRCASLVVGEQAEISGEIMAEKIVVRGRVNGRIHARHVQLAKSAKVYGDILHDALSIETGAFLEGHCRRNDPKDQKHPTTQDPVQETRKSKLAAVQEVRAKAVA